MAGKTMDIGKVGIWTGVLDSVPSAEAQALAQRIEALGFPTLWIPETIARDPFVTATLLLSATTKLKIATGIANIYARDALTMANTQRSLEEAFPGRFLLGLGVSHEHLVDRVRHHDYSKPYSAMVKYLDDMDNALFMGVGPAERPATVLAALGPKMLTLAGEKADGAHPYFVPVEHTAQAREILGPDRVLIPEQKVYLGTDPEQAHQVARRMARTYLALPNYTKALSRFGLDDSDLTGEGSERFLDQAVIWGSDEEIRAGVDAHLDAGADQVAVQILPLDPTEHLPREEWRHLAAILMPSRSSSS